jgi:hypothetical protein
MALIWQHHQQWCRGSTSAMVAEGRGGMEVLAGRDDNNGAAALLEEEWVRTGPGALLAEQSNSRLLFFYDGNLCT